MQHALSQPIRHSLLPCPRNTSSTCTTCGISSGSPPRRRRGGSRDTQGNQTPTPVTHRRYHHDNRRTNPRLRLVSRPRSRHARQGGRRLGHDAASPRDRHRPRPSTSDRQAGIRTYSATPCHSFLVISHSPCNLLLSVRLISVQWKGGGERGGGEGPHRVVAIEISIPCSHLTLRGPAQAPSGPPICTSSQPKQTHTTPSRSSKLTAANPPPSPP